MYYYCNAWRTKQRIYCNVSKTKQKMVNVQSSQPPREIQRRRKKTFNKYISMTVEGVEAVEAAEAVLFYRFYF